MEHVRVLEFTATDTLDRPESEQPLSLFSFCRIRHEIVEVRWGGPKDELLIIVCTRRFNLEQLIGN